MSDKKTIWSAALTVIGVNIAIFAICMSLALSNSSRIDLVHQRTDTIQLMIYDILKELKK